MRKIDETLANLRHLTSAKTDKDLSEILGFSYSSLDRWKAEDNIPAKRLMEFSKQLGVSMDILMGNGVKVVGDGNIAFSGDGNFVSEPKNSKLQSKIFKEFMELYTEYGNDKLLMPVIEKLREIEQIIQK